MGSMPIVGTIPTEELRAKEKASIDDIFSYHAPKGDQPARYEAIRAKARELAHIILDNVPSCADRSSALRKLREAVMVANAAIALEGKV